MKQKIQEVIEDRTVYLTANKQRNFFQNFMNLAKKKSSKIKFVRYYKQPLMNKMNKVKRIFQYKKQKILIYEKGLQILDGLVDDQTCNLVQPSVQIMTLLMFRIYIKQVIDFLSMFEENSFVLEGKKFILDSNPKLEEQMTQFKNLMNKKLNRSQNKVSRLHEKLFKDKLHRPLQEQFGWKEPNLIQMLRNHETEPLGIKYCDQLKKFLIKYCIPSNLRQQDQNYCYTKILQIDFICSIEKLYPNKQPYNTQEMKEKFQGIDQKMKYSQTKQKILRIKVHKRSFIQYKIKLTYKCLELLGNTEITRLYLPNQYYRQVLQFILLNWYHLQLKNFSLSLQNNSQSLDFMTEQLKRQVKRFLQQSEAKMTQSYNLLCGIYFVQDQIQMESNHRRIVAFIRYYQSIIQSRILNEILSQFLYNFGMPKVTSQTTKQIQIWRIAASLYLLNVKQNRYPEQQSSIETCEKQFKKIQKMDIAALKQFINQIAPEEYIY